MDQFRLDVPQKSLTEQAAPQGPCELDPRLFALVSGGAPRDGGWAPAEALDPGDAPRDGGW